MPQCAVDTCRNSHRQTRYQAVHYHRFPKPEKVRDLWVRACGRVSQRNGDTPFNINTARVCSRHFPDESYEDESSDPNNPVGKRNRLRPGAVPTIDVPVQVQPCEDLLNSRKRSALNKLSKHSKRKRLENEQKAVDCDRKQISNDDDNDGDCSNGDMSVGELEPVASTSRQADEWEVNEREEQERCTANTKEMSQETFLRGLNLISNLNNKMHAMEGAIESKKKVSTAEDNKPPKTSPSSSKVPQNQQNGAALPEETAAASTTAVGHIRTKKETVTKDEMQEDAEMSDTKISKQLLASTSRQKDSSPTDLTQHHAEPVESVKKRKSTEGQLSSFGNRRKKICVDSEREKYISEVVGDESKTIDQLMDKAGQLRHEILYLENSAREKEMEWNEILRKRKLKEEAYARLERKIHMIVYMENDGQLQMPSTKSSLASIDWENSGNTTPISREKSFGSKDDLSEERSSDSVAPKRERTAKTTSQQRTTPPKTNGESSRKQNEASSPDSRQIGEGRQGAIVDVRSIIADHRLKHPEAVPRRGRRMRNSVNIGLGAGGAMVETGHNADSRPSSTESCKSNPSTSDSMNYKDILMQFAKMSQQGEPVKVPQNYPDVTLHPVAPSSAGQNTASQPSGSLLHGILTKAQSPRSNTFSPTLARLLTAPERERNSPVTAAVASMSQQSATTHLQTYQGSNMVSINDLLSSSKARTEITITPVVNTPAQSHSNDLIQVEDADEEATMIDDRKGNLVGGRDNKQMAKDNPPSPSAPPKCQGCMTRPAQFVCAGCGNQWYCSRGCQLASWATHSDYCPPESENSKVKSNV
ncbi:uncharacterized protein [Linepithema humile]|uniref:uncharacterized protein isoform X4 n=1 Tax=Linepithema humile TaxID=83485 RepID=UPI0006238B1B|nr:PREDICTED: uncharacterized protein LOC105675678 isoform X4 [Linepithema humile]